MRVVNSVLVAALCGGLLFVADPSDAQRVNDVTADQLASIQAAYLDNKQVKIKVKSDGAKGSIAIKLKGSANAAIKK